MVFRLDKELWFPNPRLGEDDGLIAVGGDLSVDRLLLAYSHGFFPWYSYQMHKEPVWYCPMDRFVIFPDEIHISHSMRTLLNKGIYTVTFNKDFDSVIRGCSEANARNKEERVSWQAVFMACASAAVFSARVCSRLSPVQARWL